jgi:hypothetical protein
MLRSLNKLERKNELIAGLYFWNFVSMIIVIVSMALSRHEISLFILVPLTLNAFRIYYIQTEGLLKSDRELKREWF